MTPTSTITASTHRISALRSHPVCRRIKAAVLAIEPEAEVLLFGSRARGDAREDSDWDVLVLLDEVSFKGDIAITEGLYYAFPPEYGTHIATIVRTKNQMHNQQTASLFLRTVAVDAVLL